MVWGNRRNYSGVSGAPELTSRDPHPRTAGYPTQRVGLVRARPGAHPAARSAAGSPCCPAHHPAAAPPPPSQPCSFIGSPLSALAYLQVSFLGVLILTCMPQDWCSWADTSDSSLTKEEGLR